MIDLRNCTFLIPTLIDSDDRLQNILLVIKYLTTHLDTNIFIGEQKNIRCEVKKQLDIHNIKSDNVKCFELDIESTYFNRSRIFNQLALFSQTKCISLYDTDVLLFPEQYVISNKLICEDYFDMVYPYDGHFYNVPKSYREKIFTNPNLQEIKIDDCYLVNPNSLGGVVFYNRKSFISGGMENENFKGWGYEDNERLARFIKLGYKQTRTTGALYHFVHEVKKNNSNFYLDNSENDNLSKLKLIEISSREELENQMSRWEWIPKKKSNKKKTKLSFKIFQSGSLSVPSGSIGTGSTGIKSRFVDWYQGNDEREVTFITDNRMLHSEFISSIKGIKVAWLIEPEEVDPTFYKQIQFLKSHFDYIFTHDISLIDNNKILFCPLAGHWIKEKHIYQKTKKISIIASDKNMLLGHKIRHCIIRDFPNSMDVFGTGYMPINDKLYGMKDFGFHIVVENIKKDLWFTEKLIDSFVTGSIPVYWGAPSIGRLFDTRGMILFDTIEDIRNILNDKIKKSYYDSCKPFIEENFKIAMNDFLTPEDYMAKKIFEWN
jgi:hypothetical protein